jgi:hypothetical protein
MTSDLLWVIAMIIMGIICLVFNIKKDPNYKDRYGYRIRLLFVGAASVILGIYGICKILFFTQY